MPVTIYYLSDGQTSGGTGGLIYDLQGPNVELGTPTTLNDLTNLDTFTDALSFNANVLEAFGGVPKGSEFYTSVSVPTITGTLEYRFRVERLNSAGVSQNQTAYSPIYTAAGTNAHIYTGATWPWVSTDLIHFTCEVRRSGGHGNVSIDVAVNNLNSFVGWRQNHRVNIS